MLNTDKTEVMPVDTSFRLSQRDCNSANIRGNNIPFKTSGKYLCVTIDQTVSMQDLISSVYCASFFELRRLASIQPYLSGKKTGARLVAASITSRHDYRNCVLACLPAEQICRLQRVQNSAARLVLKKRNRDHITPLLNEGAVIYFDSLGAA